MDGMAIGERTGAPICHGTTPPAILPDETIHLGPLTVRLLLSTDNSSGSIATFELTGRLT
jgi:hypothetical protein